MDRPIVFRPPRRVLAGIPFPTRCLLCVVSSVRYVSCASSRLAGAVAAVGSTCYPLSPGATGPWLLVGSPWISGGGQGTLGGWGGFWRFGVWFSDRGVE